MTLDRDELNRRSLSETIKRMEPGLGAAEHREAVRVAKAAFHDNVTYGDAAEAGIRYVKDRREGK